jgi:hypothetical protein
VGTLLSPAHVQYAPLQQCHHNWHQPQHNTQASSYKNTIARENTTTMTACPPAVFGSSSAVTSHLAQVSTIAATNILPDTCARTSR